MKKFDIYAADAESFDVREADWVRLTVSIDAECLARYSELASRAGMSRSRFLGMHLMFTEAVGDRAFPAPVPGVH